MPSVGDHDDADEDVPGLRDRRVGEHPLQRRLPERADVADQDRDDGDRDPDGAPVVDDAGCSAVSKSRMITANAAIFVATDMNAGDRRRRAFVDVRRPLVERRHRRLEREADDRHADAGQDEHVAGEALARRAARRSSP